MIHILDNSECCGCSACLSVCPRECITMHEDKEGFLYPSVDADKCVDCRLCEKNCPELHPGSEITPLKTLAAYNPHQEIREESSSGGMFSLISESVIKEGGVVFGAEFDSNWGVRHTFVETCDELSRFRGSKYLQSVIGDTYSEAKQFLNSGRKVLFSGTPCQIAGLKNYLGKDYENLLTLDIVCHGVPSPMVWKKYLESLAIMPVTDVSFRDKKCGWKGYKVKISSAKTDVKEINEFFLQNRFMQVFLSDLSLRPSCYNCKFKSGSSGSDITLGDFWGIDRIDPAIDDDRGMSLILVNTSKGERSVRECGMKSYEKGYAEAVKFNPAIVCSSRRPAYRDYFMDNLVYKDFNNAYDLTCGKSLYKKIRRRLWLYRRGI